MSAGTYHKATGGMAHESTALRGLLGAQGIAISEALAFGFCGGIGLSYGVFEFGQGAHLQLGVRPQGDSLRAAADRLRLIYQVHENNSRRAAQATLIEALEAGYSPVVQADLAALPHYGLAPQLLKWLNPAPLRALAIDAAGECVLLAELPDQAVTLSLAELSAARAAQGGLRNRMFSFELADGELPFAAAAEAGIEACIEAMSEPPLSNFGLAALRKWSELANNRKEKKGWPRLLAQDGMLFDVLTSGYMAIEGLGRADALRGLFADFLDEAAALLERPALAEGAARYRDAARAWRALARALLPAGLPVLGISAQIIAHRSMIIREQGTAGLAQIQAFSRMLVEQRAAFIKGEAPRNGGREALFAAIQEAVQAVYIAEQEALIVLREVMEGSAGPWTR